MAQPYDPRAYIPYFAASAIISEEFSSSYVHTRNERDYRHDLPMTIRGWRVNLVEAKQFTVILEYTHPAVSAARVLLQRTAPELANMETLEEFATVLPLREIADSRHFPLEALEADMDLALKEEIGVLAVAWGVDMAVRHMAETHPDFERAKRRMTDAYGKLFDLEQLLRTCIEKVLTGVHGNDWWNLASIDQDIRRTVNKREGEPGNRWLDDYSTSVLRFTDLDHLRRIVEKNRHHFPAFDGEIDWFKSTMIYLTRPRNRIGHVNTLSEDDFLKFLFSADQVIALIPKDARP